MKTTFSYIILLFLLCSNSSAQTSTNRNQIGISTSINSNNAYSFEASYHYMILPSIGIGSGIGYFNQWYNDYLPLGNTDGKWTSWTVSDDFKKISKLYLRPSILLKSPKILNIGKYDLSFQVEPGLQIIVPYTGLYVDYKNTYTNDRQSKYVSTSIGNWCFWELKSCFKISAGDVSLAIGYGVSNLDIYSSRRNLSVENTSFQKFYPNKKNTHSIFINIGHSF